MPRSPVVVSLLAVSASAWLACSSKEVPQDTYFERNISPIVTTACSRGPTGAGCHVADARGNAFGNLDTSTFQGIDRRRDLLQAYGPYNQPGLLLKVLPPMQLEVRAFDGTSVTVTGDVRHTGGPILDPAGSAFRVLRHWIDAGATVNNTGRVPSKMASLPCNVVAASSTHDLAVDPPTPDFAKFRDEVQPLLVQKCGDGNCHGSPGNDLQIACGSAAEDVRANYWASVDYLGADPGQSELVRRPLAPSAGGTFHEGGAIWETPDDSELGKLRGWAIAHGPAAKKDLTKGFDFFAHRVQPVLVRKGCMQMQCHSASIFHDYRLRGGSSGSFSYTATKKNYDLSIAQLDIESDDIRASRLVRKNLFRPAVMAGAPGIVHRGGALFEDMPGATANPADCDGKSYDYDGGNLDEIPAICVLREWLGRERAARPLTPLSGIVYVSRDLPLAGMGLLEFDTYAPGSDIHIASFDATLAVTNDRSVTAGCGLTPATADIKRPMVAWDGSTIAFAARTSASAPLRIYEMKADGTGCAPIDEIGAHDATGNGLLIHDFDPAYSPPLPGGGHALIFASTRGNLDPGPYDYAGPQRTPADPSRPNANLYAWEPDPKDPTRHRIRQLTFLLNTERAPAFMADGRIVHTVEKRMPGFAQIGLRRINLDGGDYHPLFGQRGSVGYRDVSQVVHLADKNFAAIFADRGIPGRGGALGVFNRSMGVELLSPDPKDYPADPTVTDPAAIHTPDPAFFLHSMHLPDPSSSGRASGNTSGQYATPAPLPDARILASWGAAPFTGDYDVYAIDAATGARTKVLGVPGKAEVEAVAIYGRPPRNIYRSVASEPNAYALDESKVNAEVLMNDADVIFSLNLQNTPTGRVVDPDVRSFELWEELPPTPEVTSMDKGDSFVHEDEFGKVYVRRRLLGAVPVMEDGSARYTMTGGLPFVIKLPDTKLSTERKIPRTIQEHMMFTPGESVHMGFPRDAFNGFCGGCHGSVSGRPVDAVLKPDVLSRASDTIAFRSVPTLLDKPPGQRGPVVGP